MVYPNRHAVGMANLGYQAVVGLLSDAGIACHRAFTDHPRTLEAGRSLGDYPVVALSLSFEGDYPAALDLLAAAGVALRADQRGDEDPLVLAGGVAVSLNPAALGAFLDVVFVGEAEAGLEDLCRLLQGLHGRSRAARLRAVAEAGLPGVYVPPLAGDHPQPVERRWAPPPWPPAHTRIQAPDDAFRGAFLVEISRGCPHACRFCAAGHLTRPTRPLPVAALAPWLRFGAREVGRVGLVGAAVSDHPAFEELAEGVLAAGGELTVSSFRAENLDAARLELLVRGGLRTLTVAAEAGSETLRRRVGKQLRDAQLEAAAGLAGAAGLANLRIYAMVGLPGEEPADLEALAALARRVRQALGGGTVTLSVAPFVPKPHTPLQWAAMLPEAELRRRIRHLQKLCVRERGLQVVAEAPKWSRLQGFFARADRRAAPAIEAAARSGDWRALLRTPLARELLDRQWDVEAPLPWDFLTGVPSGDHLRREWLAAARGAAPLPCAPGPCRACGVCPPHATTAAAP